MPGKWKHRVAVAVSIAAMAIVSVACSDSSERADSAEVAPLATEGDDLASTDTLVGSSDDTTASVAATSTVAGTDESAADGEGEGEGEGENAGVPDPASGDSDYLFAQDQLHTFEITVAEDKLAELDDDPAAEDYVDGALAFNGRPFGEVGVRYKGSVGAFVFCTDSANPFAPDGPKNCTKLSLKLKIDWDDPNAEFFGVKRVQLHSQNLDKSLMHERLGYWLFREMEVPAPRSTHARVVINGEFVGLFALTEQIDGRFTRSNFDDGTGNLYKEAWPFDATRQPRDPAEMIDSLETNKNDNPTTDVVTRFTSELAAASPDEAIDVIKEWVDVEALLRLIVVDRAIKNDDGALHWYCFEECAPHNFFWYEDPSLLRMTLIPWDLDNAFDGLTSESGIAGFIAVPDRWGEVQNDCEPFAFGPMGLKQVSAGCDPILGPVSELDAEFEMIRAEFLAGPFAEAQVSGLLDTWATQIEASVAEAARLHDDAVSVAEWRSAIDRLKVGLAQSRAGDGR